MIFLFELSDFLIKSFNFLLVSLFNPVLIRVQLVYSLIKIFFKSINAFKQLKLIFSLKNEYLVLQSIDMIFQTVLDILVLLHSLSIALNQIQNLLIFFSYGIVEVFYLSHWGFLDYWCQISYMLDSAIGLFD
jgi:hypothetical protein